jgi:hypothetical protein
MGVFEQWKLKRYTNRGCGIMWLSHVAATRAFSTIVRQHSPGSQRQRDPTEYRSNLRFEKERVDVPLNGFERQL